MEAKRVTTISIGAFVLASLIVTGIVHAAALLTLASVSSVGVEGDGPSLSPSVSADGRFVAFYSRATTLVPGDTNGYWDIFVRDLSMGTTSRVSVSSTGEQANHDSQLPSLSGDGRYIAFFSVASNLVPDDTNNEIDIFVHDQISGATERVSVSSTGEQANGASFSPVISTDGRYVAFMSWASNLVPNDTNWVADIFVHDLQTGNTTRVSVDSFGQQANDVSDGPDLSGDGRYVAFQSDASNLAPGEMPFFPTTDVFVRDLVTGITTMVSNNVFGWPGGGREPSISGDGRYVAFTSDSSIMPEDTNSLPDIFVRDLQTGTISRISLSSAGEQANGLSYEPDTSADGRFVSFTSFASNLVPGDTNNQADVFLHDLQTGTTMRQSVSAGGEESNGYSFGGSLDADGNLLAFSSFGSNLVPSDANGQPDVFAMSTASANKSSVVDAGPDATIDEGSLFISAGSFIDPDANTWTATVDYGDDSGVEPLALNPDQTFVLSHTYIENGVYVVTVVVTDSEGDTGSDSLAVTVANAAPVVDAGADMVITSGDTFELSVAFTDAGILDTHTATIGWGDGSSSTGSVTETLGSGSISGSHTYYVPETRAVQICVTDDDGAVGCDSLSLQVVPLTVNIDVRPESDLNAVNCSEAAPLISVAVLSTATFDATTLDPNSVHFGPAGATEVHRDADGNARVHVLDVNGDSLPDLVFHFRFGETGLVCGDTLVSLTGVTFGGVYVLGSESITTRPE